MFDGSFSREAQPWEGIDQMKVIPPWIPWYVAPGEGSPPTFKRPEWGANKEHTLPEKEQSQKIHHNFATWEGGIMQMADVKQGANVLFVADVMLKSGKKDSDAKGDGTVWVGIDPDGKGDPWAEGIIWTPTPMIGVYDQWRTISVGTKSRAGRVNLLFRCTWKWPVDWNDLFIGEARLNAEPPDPDPPAGDHVLRVLLDDIEITRVPLVISIKPGAIS